MQATAQNPTVARILGIPVERMVLYTFLINAALVALASLLITPIYLAKFSTGETSASSPSSPPSSAASTRCAAPSLGGLLVGIVDNLVAAYVSAQYRNAVPLVLLIAVILFRPQGLLGRAEERTV